jgi:cytochrome c oxidase subunit 3
VANEQGLVAHQEHHPALAHHFTTLEQQHDANILGMWIFLATEVMLFGGLFLAYTVYHTVYPAAFAEAAKHQNLLAGAVNTAVLITSSLMVALAIHYAQLGNRRLAVGFLLFAAGLGTLFLCIKGLEYYQHFLEDLVPGVNFPISSLGGNTDGLFFALYFIMTGLHAIHLTIGIGLVLFMALRVWRGHFLRERFTGLEMVGLYWHFIDIIWIFLFPLFYLITLQ